MQKQPKRQAARVAAMKFADLRAVVDGIDAETYRRAGELVQSIDPKANMLGMGLARDKGGRVVGSVREAVAQLTSRIKKMGEEPVSPARLKLIKAALAMATVAIAKVRGVAEKDIDLTGLKWSIGFQEKRVWMLLECGKLGARYK